jgi:hypothetical protein
MCVNTVSGCSLQMRSDAATANEDMRGSRKVIVKRAENINGKLVDETVKEITDPIQEINSVCWNVFEIIFVFHF